MQLDDDTSSKVRRQGAVQATTVMLGVGTGSDVQRELLGLHLAYGETESDWHRFKRLKVRELSGVRVATRDARGSPRQTLHAAFPGLVWQTVTRTSAET